MGKCGSTQFTQNPERARHQEEGSGAHFEELSSAIKPSARSNGKEKKEKSESLECWGLREKKRKENTLHDYEYGSSESLHVGQMQFLT